MELYEIFKELLSEVGFPIACCVAMFVQNGKLKNSLDNNTAAINQMKETLIKKEVG